MAASIQTVEPQRIRAGTTWQWLRALADYPATTWTLTYRLRNADGYIDLAGSADGSSHLISVSAETTASYAAGRYDWVAFVSDGTDTFEIDAGVLQIDPDLSALAAYDARPWARRMLDAVEAILEGRATANELDMIDAQLEGRGIKRDRSSLLELRSKLLIEVRRIEGTGGRVSTINARFG